MEYDAKVGRFDTILVLIAPLSSIFCVARLFLAGQETTSHTLAWALYFLAKRPEVMARCRTEAMEKISSRSGTRGMVVTFSTPTLNMDGWTPCAAGDAAGDAWEADTLVKEN